MPIPEEPSPDGPDIRVIEELIGLARAGNKAALDELVGLACAGSKAALDGLVGLAQAGNKAALDGLIRLLAQAGSKAALNGLVGLAQAGSKAAFDGLIRLAQVGSKAAFVELVKLAQAGYKEACSFLFERYNDRVFSYLLLILGNWHDAEELTQETFLKALVNLPKLEDPALFESWLFRIAKNLATDHFRRRKRHRDNLLFSEIERPVSSEPFESDDSITIRYPGASSPDFSDSIVERDIIMSVLAKMPPKQRNCFLLKEVVGLSPPETAEILEIGQQTVITYLSMARRFFKEHYPGHQE